jgi:hypothetical protein
MKQSSRNVTTICAGLALLLGSGCVPLSASFYTSELSPRPSRSPTQIDGRATVEVVCALTPDMQKFWTWAKKTMANYLKAETEILRFHR